MLSGYSRRNEDMGARNHVAIIPTAGCVNDFIRKIEQNVPGTVPILHHQGCAQLKPDLEQVTQILIGLGINPNVTGVLVVSLGCESIVPQEVVDGIASSGKPVSLLSLQEEGGYTKALQKGIDVASKMCVEANTQERKPFSLEDLVLGIKCGATDTTSGLVANPVIGVVVDWVIDAGGTVIFGETTEIIGAEHILAKRAVNQRVSKRVYEIVERMEAKAKALGVDMRGSQPTGGNIRGGLTSIEEKSLGAIVKGLYFMDSPGMEIVYLTGPAAGGVQALLFSTGLGAPQGFPLYPVIKVCGNERTSNHLAEHIDVDVSPVLRGEETLVEAGDRLFTELVQVVSGKKTNAETLGFDSTVDIYTLGSFI